VLGPKEFALYQNYPNPFNPSTTIKFALPIDSKVKINVYNSLGQLVETLVDQEMQSGYHEINFDASKLTSGVYLYQMQAGENVSVKKMILMK
jgi:flagellar hook assembly protein FlgD